MIRNQKITKHHLRWLSSLSSKTGIFIFALVAFLLFNQRASAVNISAVYFSACMRETGVVINTDENYLQMMTLKGEIRNIPRFDIIYIAQYPVGNIHIPEVINPEESEIIKIKTLYDDKVVDLVEGWMIDYSEEQISFLTLSGTQTVIDTADIWDIEILPAAGEISFQSDDQVNFEFAHPYPFMHCRRELNGAGGGGAPVHLIYPQSLLAEPFQIKKELDRMKEGYDKLRDYDSSKRFYPVPQVYSNETSLGIWMNLGNRYGSSKNRSNSFIPAIVSELTEGPFGFQRILVTGSAPMPYGIHEEPQIQAYYRLKASYVHFSIMVDIARFNMGSQKYKWSREDMEEQDNRENEIFHLAGGFDYGPFAIDISVTNSFYYSVRNGDHFHEDDMNLNKGGLFYHNRFLRMEVYYGFADDAKDPIIPIPDDASAADKAWIDAHNAELEAKPDFYADYLFYRFNLELFNMGKIHPKYSLIFREIDFERENNKEGEGQFRYASQSLTNALYLDYPLGEDLKISGYLSVEMLQKKYGIKELDDNKSSTYPKGGFSMALLF